ncbi:MAG: ABC transporter ATP-binding protein [Bacteroidota bacterium]|nr:ABC transporter ATP-binding protein [Bacteroidota bacterium]MDW8137087.1 ABC transporter ATP-binding protein [Bacteroidota bacterium]
MFGSHHRVRIRVEALQKSFDGQPVLRGVDLSIYEGETFCIIGRSGTGKSVLLKHLVGLLVPDSGTVWVDDQNIFQLSYEELRRVRRRFGVLFQGAALFDSLNTAENVAFPLRMVGGRRWTEAEIQERVRRCLAEVGLEDMGHKYPAELSGGMRKRVGLARAIALEPEFILYDEPTSGLDPETAETINELIRKLARELRVTSIVVTHDMHSVLQIADRAGLLHEGRLHWVGTIEEMRRSQDPILLRFVKASEYQL